MRRFCHIDHVQEAPQDIERLRQQKANETAIRIGLISLNNISEREVRGDEKSKHEAFRIR